MFDLACGIAVNEFKSPMPDVESSGNIVLWPSLRPNHVCVVYRQALYDASIEILASQNEKHSRVCLLYPPLYRLQLPNRLLPTEKRQCLFKISLRNTCYPF